MQLDVEIVCVKWMDNKYCNKPCKKYKQEAMTQPDSGQITAHLKVPK